MTDEYKPHSYSIGFRVTEEMEEDGVADVMHENLSSLAENAARWMDIRMMVDLGMGLDPDNAKFLLKALDEAQKTISEEPPKTILWTVRKWLSRKLDPEFSDYDD